MRNLSKLILPGQTIGIIGGGQLGRMMAFSAKEMGFFVGILDPTPDCPAAQVADWHIIADYNDELSLLNMSKRCDVITYEFENVDVDGIKYIEKMTHIPQGTIGLSVTQDRLSERSFLESNNINIAPYETVVVVSDIRDSVSNIGFPCVVKTTRGGYDGKGQVVLYSEEDIDKSVPLIQHGPCILEAFIPFVKELSVMIAANQNGDYTIFPIVENIHKNSILQKTIAPVALGQDIVDQIHLTAKIIASGLQLSGVMGIEMFLTEEGTIYVNELAPRPHNSAHYSIEACNFSQFDAHIRGICNWPLPEITLLSPAVMLNILGEQVVDVFAQIPEKKNWHFHLYGKKELKEGRKVGHVTILTENLEETLQEIAETNIWD